MVKSPGHYWDPEWETADPEALIPKIENRLQDQLTYTYNHSSFYKHKFDESGINPSLVGLKDLHHLPFTTKEEIRKSQEVSPPLGEHVCVDWKDISRIHASSGTTGRPTMVGATQRDREMWNELVARCLWAQGARPESRAWVALSLGWWIAGICFFEGLQHLGAAVLPGGNTEAARSFNVIKQTGLDYMISTPSFAQYLARFAREQLDLNPADLGLKHMGLGGEAGGGLPHIRKQIEDDWGCKVYDCMGTADFSTVIWSECEAQDGMHFQGQGLIIPEIIDPKDATPIEPKPGVVGELVYTAIWRECTPLIRFRIGDLVEVVGDGRCDCGRTGLRIRCVGRVDDMLTCLGVNIYPSAVADVVASFRPRTTGHIQIVGDGTGVAVQPPVKIRVEYEQEPNLANLKAELEKKIREELIFKASVELVPKGTLAPQGGMKTALVTHE